MFVKLQLKYQGIPIEFDIHEVVSIANNLVLEPKSNTEKIDIPSPSDWIKKFHTLIEAYVQKAVHPLLLIPMLIDIPTLPIMNKPGQWNYVARNVFENKDLEGIWCNIGGRLILFRASNNYCADYGNIAKTLQKTFIANISLEWGNNKFAELYKNITKIINEKENSKTSLALFNFSVEEVRKLKIWLGASSKKIQALSLNDNHYKKLPFTEDEVSEIQKNLVKIKTRKAKDLGEKLIKSERIRFNQLKNDWDGENSIGHLNAFRNEISERGRFLEKKKEMWDRFELIFKKDNEDFSLDQYILEFKKDGNDNITPYLLKVFAILFLDACTIARGNAEPLYKIETFGKQKKGASYPDIAKKLLNYDKDSESKIQLATQVRKLLTGEELANVPDFLPTLTTAWFLGESARNNVSFLDGLILLDFLENGESAKTIISDNYCWQYTCINPKHYQKYKKIRDIYGNQHSVRNVGGLHSMTHTGSYIDMTKEKPFFNGAPLNIVRQKEGSLILHWLSLVIRKYCPEIEVTLFSIKDIKGNKIKESEISYDEVNTSENGRSIAIESLKNQGKSSKNYDTELKRLQVKERLQHEWIEPLLKLRLTTFYNYVSDDFKDLVKPITVNNERNKTSAIPAENSDNSLIIKENYEKSLRKSNLQHIDYKGKNASAGITDNQSKSQVISQAITSAKPANAKALKSYQYFNAMKAQLEKLNSLALPEALGGTHEIIQYLNYSIRQNCVVINAFEWDMHSDTSQTGGEQIETYDFPFATFINDFLQHSEMQKFILPILLKQAHFVGLAIIKQADKWQVKYINPTSSNLSPNGEDKEALAKINQALQKITNEHQVVFEEIEILSNNQQMNEFDCAFIVAQTLVEVVLEQEISIKPYSENMETYVKPIAQARAHFYSQERLGDSYESAIRDQLYSRLAKALTTNWADYAIPLQKFIRKADANIYGLDDALLQQMQVLIQRIDKGNLQDLLGSELTSQATYFFNASLILKNIKLIEIKKFCDKLLKPHFTEQGSLIFKLNDNLQNHAKKSENGIEGMSSSKQTNKAHHTFFKSLSSNSAKMPETQGAAEKRDELAEIEELLVNQAIQESKPVGEPLVEFQQEELQQHKGLN